MSDRVFMRWIFAFAAFVFILATGMAFVAGDVVMGIIFLTVTVCMAVAIVRVK
jgi:hypothetical protein